MLSFIKVHDLPEAALPWFDGFEPLAKKIYNTLIYCALPSSVKYFSDTIAKPGIKSGDNDTVLEVGPTGGNVR